MSFWREERWGNLGENVEKWGWVWYDVTIGVEILEGEEEMKTLEKYKDEQMKDSSFVKEYEAIQPETDVIRAIVEARMSQNMTQKEPAERTGIN